MAATSVYSPSIDEKKWVSQGNRTLDSELIIQIDFTPTIYQVPKAMSESKPEAYTPQQLGLGAYHHLRPELHITDMQKLAAVKKFLQQNSSKNFSEDFLGKMKDLEPVARAYYDKYLDLEGSTLEYIIAIDSFFLLDFLGSYDDKTEAENLEPGCQELGKDVVMLENQIPAFALVEMGKELDLFSPDRGTQETMLYSQLFYYFCKAHSPLELAKQWQIRRSESKHLLAHMYHLIVNNHSPKMNVVLFSAYTESISTESIIEKGIECLKILRELGLGGAMINPLLFAFKSLQVLENSKLVEELTKNKEQKPKIQKIEIPSVSELTEKYKVGFMLLKDRGIRDIEFVYEGKHKLFLPEITLRCDSEVVLRNLVAYEAAVKSTFELAEYVDLMCGIVHTTKDVAMLRERGIVKGNLNDEQVFEIFNGISRSVGKSKKESASQKALKQVNEMVGEWENRKWYKRLYRFLQKIVKRAVEFLRKPYGIAMKYLTYIFMALLLLLQILQAYCQVYGCSIGGSQALSWLSD